MTHRGKTATLSLCALMAALTVVGAYIKITIGQVPITLQTLFVYLSGNILTPGFAAAAQGTYLICGLIGLPVFTMGGGPASVLQPTFGYLISFPIASMIISKIIGMQQAKSNHKNVHTITVQRIILANAIGGALIFTIGVLYLYLNLNFITDNTISLKTALWIGFIVFIPGEIIKVILAAIMSNKLNKHFLTTR